MSAALAWTRPGLAKKIHAFAPSMSLSLCQSWRRLLPIRVRTDPTAEKNPEPMDRCRECTHKAQAKQYRRGGPA